MIDNTIGAIIGCSCVFLVFFVIGLFVYLSCRCEQIYLTKRAEIELEKKKLELEYEYEEEE